MCSLKLDATKMPPNFIWIDSGGIFWCQKPLYFKQSSKHATPFSGWFLTHPFEEVLKCITPITSDVLSHRMITKVHNLNISDKPAPKSKTIKE